MVNFVEMNKNKQIKKNIMKITLLEYKNGQNLLELDLPILPRKNEFIEHEHVTYQVEKIIHSVREIQVYVIKQNENYSDAIEAEFS